MTSLTLTANIILITQYLTTPLIFLSIIQLNRSAKVGKKIKLVRVVSTCLYMFDVFCIVRVFSLALQPQLTIITLCEIVIIATIAHTITGFYTGDNSPFISKWAFYTYGVKETLKSFTRS